ncbi:MAG: AI-2E family transporter, partial [Janthinobacterium sp.]
MRLPLHVNARGLALGIIATVSFIYALQWAQKFLIPVIFGIFIAYTLNPVVGWLEKLRLPRAIGATAVTALILFGSIVVVERVQGEFESIMEELPAATHKLSRLIAANTGGKNSTFQKMQAVANEIEQVAAGAETRRNNRRAAAAEAPNFKIMDWV